MIRLHAVITALAVSVPMLAQTPAGDAPKRDRVQERAQDMREQIDTGRSLMSHVRVAVRLKNGNRLQGVVKDGRLVERVDGLRFVDAQAQESGAGIRLWYSTGRRNYVFVPFSDLAEYEVQERLSQKQLDAMEQTIQMNESKRDEEVQKAQAQAQKDAEAAKQAEANPADPAVPAAPGQEPAPPKADAKNGKTGDAANKDAPTTADALKEQQKEWVALLQDYPPSAGWSKEKRDEISRRKVVIGATPSEKEQRFVAKFDEWQKACLFFDVKAEPKKEGDSADDSSNSSNSRNKHSSRSKKESSTSESTPTSESGETDRHSRRKKS